MKRELERAIRAAGGSAAALARRLRVHPSTVRRWRSKGVPKTGNARRLLADYKQVRKDARESKRRDRQTFEKLMKLAKQAGKLPAMRSEDRKRIGPKTSGHMWTLALNRMLTLDMVDEIEAWGVARPRKWPIWQAAIVVSMYGPGEHRGYGTVYFQLSAEAGDFAIESTLATPRSTSRSSVLGYVRDQLESLSIDPTLTVFVHAVTLYNYRLRSEVERRSWETSQRRQRAKGKSK